MHSLKSTQKPAGAAAGVLNTTGAAAGVLNTTGAAAGVLNTTGAAAGVLNTTCREGEGGGSRRAAHAQCHHTSNGTSLIRPGYLPDEEQ